MGRPNARSVRAKSLPRIGQRFADNLPPSTTENQEPHDEATVWDILDVSGSDIQTRLAEELLSWKKGAGSSLRGVYTGKQVVRYVHFSCRRSIESSSLSRWFQGHQLERA